MPFEESVFRPKQLDEEKWESRRINDETNFHKELSMYFDKRGVIGDELFDLTLDNYGSSRTYRNVSTIGGDSIAKGLFYALCPELESFVTLVNWMGSSDERKEHRVEYYKDIGKFITEGKSNEVCHIHGNYRLKLESYTDIILFRSEVKIDEKDESFYEWERAPFLKRSGETFAYFPSPIFMSTVKSDLEGVSEEKVSYFTSLFKLRGIQGNKAAIDVYNCTNPYSLITEVSVYETDVLNKLKQNSSSLFIGLFEDRLFRKSGLNREFVLLDLSDELDGNEIAGHFIAQRMYYNYLAYQNLYICSNDDFEKRCNTVFHQIRRTHGQEVSMPFSFFVETYLRSFFIKINGIWYYKPFILRNLDSKSFSEFLTYCNNLEDAELCLCKYLYFLNRYNYYAKRTLIDIIRNPNFINKEGKSKWEM